MGKKKANIFIYVILGILTVVVLYPLYFIVLNSFKGKFYISKQPFELPKGELFAGLTNYTNGLEQTGLIEAAGWSFFITIVSVVLIIFFTSMTAYYVTRVKGKTTSVLYYLFVFSMVVPFQMVMFTMVDLADKFHLRNPLGMCILYLGFGAGLSVFMFSGFVKSIPLEIEEAAMIDGANRFQRIKSVTLPSIAPTISIMLIMQIGRLMSLGYEKIILLYNGSTYETADVISTYVYRRGILSADFSYSTAVGLFQSVIGVILLVASNQISKKLSDSSLW